MEKCDCGWGSIGEIISIVIGCILGGALMVSFFFSTMRIAGSSTTCEKLNIDRLEPFISTRWFCPTDKK